MLTKTDRLPYTDVVINVMRGYRAKINPRPAVFETGPHKERFDSVLPVDYLREQVGQKQN